jgi:AP-1 complex subunit gamma-1
MDLFNNTGTPSPAPFAQSSAPPAPSASSDLLGMGNPSPQSGPPPIHEAYNKNGLSVSFQLQRPGNAIQVLARFRNTGLTPLSAVNLQAAVPKSQKLQLQQISSAEIPVGGEASQQMRVQAVSGVSVSSSLYLLGWFANVCSRRLRS